MRGFISLLLLAGIFQGIFAQTGLGIRQYPYVPFALSWQAAAHAGGSNPSITLVSRIGVGSNRLAFSQWPIGDSVLVLDSANINSIAAQMGDQPLRLQQLLATDLWYTMQPSDKRPLTFGLRQMQSLGGGLTQANTVRLLYSNIGIDSLSETGLHGWSSNAYAFSVGTNIIQKDSFYVGARLNLIGGTSFWGLQTGELRYGYSPTPTAEEIRVGAQYALFRSKGSLPGMGVSMDIGAFWDKHNWLFQVAANNIGAIRWQGETYHDTFNVAFSGISFPNSDSAWADSLLAVFQADTTTGARIQRLAPDIYASAQYLLPNYWRIVGAVQWTLPSPYHTATSPSATIGLGKSWVFNGKYFIAPMLSSTVGGFNKTRFGAAIQGSVMSQNGNMYRLFVAADYASTASQTTYVGGSTGISIGF